MLVQIHANQKLIENFWVGIVKSGCGQSGDRFVKLTVSEE